MSTTAELFARVYARPEDDEARQVLADHLLEEGDPRGEFIALQLRRLKGPLPPTGMKRERRLLEEHEARWLGPIARLVIGHPTRWERGFLEACGAPLDGSTVGAPEWGTVRELILYSDVGDRPGELAADLRSLRVLELANTLALDVLVKAAQKPPLESISYRGPQRNGREWAARQTDALLKLAELPRLKRLQLRPQTTSHLSGRDFAFFFESRLAHRLESLGLVMVRPVARENPPLDLASFVKPAAALGTLKQLEVEAAGLVRYTLTCDRAGALTQLSVRLLTSPAVTGTWLPTIMAGLQGLDRHALSSLEVLYTGRRLARRHTFGVDEAARRFPRVAAVEYRPAP